MPIRLEALRLSARQALVLAALSVAFAVLLAEVYAAVGSLGGEAWTGAAVVHSVLALLIIGVQIARGRASMFSLIAASGGALPWLTARTYRMYLPAFSILAGAALLVALSRILGGGLSAGGSGTKLAWILWVPLVEEVVFRAGIGQLYRRLGPPVWAAWFSALTFALVHSTPTLASLMAGRIGLALGPFLLGLACEALFSATGRLAPAVALHAACNATVAVFMLGDPRWLEWLGILYG